MKAEYVDRIDRLTELAEAEREVQAASTKFEQAQWEVVKAAEHLQEWTNVWKYRRESVLSRFPDTLTPEQITFYGQGNRLSEANEVLRQFCASVEAKNKQLSALTSPLQHKGGETEAGEDEDDALNEFLKREGAKKWDGNQQPIPNDVLVEVVFLDEDDGDTWTSLRALPAGELNWTGKNIRQSQFSATCHVIAYRIVETPADQVRTTDGDTSSGDKRIEPPISTLQASSGEGETDEAAINPYEEGRAAHALGAELWMNPYPTTHDNPLLDPGPSQEYQQWEDGFLDADLEAAKPTETPTEPAAYSPVNNADEPVTKPEADVFSHGIQAQKKEEPRKFGSIFGDITKFGRS